MFKCQLQEFCQKARLDAPVYNVRKEGPSHEPQFKASVMVQGVSYESPTFFANLKKAEHAAAEVALHNITKSNSVSVGSLHESGLCKNLLQEYAQKRKMTMPIYSVDKSIRAQSILFTATVEFGGVQYQGESCRSKKEAEIKAAGAALLAIYAESGASLQGLEEEPTFVKGEPSSVKAGPTSGCTELNSAEVELVSGNVEPNAIKEEQAKEEPPIHLGTPAEPLSGSKRKRRLIGGSRQRKAKVQEDEEDEELADKDAKEDSNSLLTGGGNGIPGITTLEE